MLQERNQTDLTSGLQDLRETASSLQTEVKVLKSALDNIIQVFTTSDEKDQEVSVSYPWSLGGREGGR